MKFYQVMDRLSAQERDRLGIPINHSFPLISCGIGVRNVHGIKTGEFRCPLKNEWFLSGSTPECYRTSQNLDTKYHIIKLIRTKTEKFTTISIVSY